MATIAEELLDIMGRLPAEQQRRVLDFARDLSQASAQGPTVQGTTSRPRSVLPPGTSPEAFRAFRPTLPPEVVDEMARVIEEECEQVEPDDELSL